MQGWVFTGGAAVEVVDIPLKPVDADALVPPTSCVYVAFDDGTVDVEDAVVFVEPVLPDVVVVKLAVAIVLPLKSEGTVAMGASSLNIAVLPVRVMISTDELSSCAVATLVRPKRMYSGPIIMTLSNCDSSLSIPKIDKKVVPINLATGFVRDTAALPKLALTTRAKDIQE